MSFKDVKKKEPSGIIPRHVSWCSHNGQTVWSFLKQTELPYDPAIPLPGTYLNKMKTVCIFLKKLKIELPCNPTIPILGII